MGRTARVRTARSRDSTGRCCMARRQSLLSLALMLRDVATKEAKREVRNGDLIAAIKILVSCGVSRGACKAARGLDGTADSQMRNRESNCARCGAATAAVNVAPTWWILEPAATPAARRRTVAIRTMPASCAAWTRSSASVPLGGSPFGALTFMIHRASLNRLTRVVQLASSAATLACDEAFASSTRRARRISPGRWTGSGHPFKMSTAASAWIVGVDDGLGWLGERATMRPTVAMAIPLSAFASVTGGPGGVRDTSQARPPMARPMLSIGRVPSGESPHRGWPVASDR